MKKSRIFIFFIIALILSNCISHKIYSGALLNKKDTYVYIYSDCHSKNVIDSVILSYDLKKESLPIISVKCIKDGYAYIFVEEFGSDNGIKKDGWVRVENLSIRAISSKDNGIVYLRIIPDRQATIIDSILITDWNQLYPIKNFKNNWFLIEKQNADGSSTCGWIAPEDQDSGYTPSC